MLTIIHYIVLRRRNKRQTRDIVAAIRQYTN